MSIKKNFLMNFIIESVFRIFDNCNTYLSKSIRSHTLKLLRTLIVYFHVFVGRDGPNGWSLEDPSYHGI